MRSSLNAYGLRCRLTGLQPDRLALFVGEDFASRRCGAIFSHAVGLQDCLQEGRGSEFDGTQGAVTPHRVFGVAPLLQHAAVNP